MELMLKSLVDVLTNVYGLLGIIFMALGLSFMFSAKSFARAVRKSNEIDKNDKAYNIWFYLGVIMVVAGVVLLACMVLIK